MKQEEELRTNIVIVKFFMQKVLFQINEGAKMGKVH